MGTLILSKKIKKIKKIKKHHCSIHSSIYRADTSQDQHDPYCPSSKAPTFEMAKWHSLRHRFIPQSAKISLVL